MTSKNKRPKIDNVTYGQALGFKKSDSFIFSSDVRDWYTGASSRKKRKGK